jgi:hypothetical protein
MRQVIGDASGKNRKIVIRGDHVKAARDTAGSCIELDTSQFAGEPGRLLRGRAARLWITAAFLATTWASETQGSPEARPAQADALTNTQHATAASNVDFGRPAGDFVFETVKPGRLGDRSVLVAQATTGDTEELRKALEQEHRRAELYERLLTLRKATAESARSNHASESEDADVQKSLQQVHDRLKQTLESGATRCKPLQGDQADGRLEQALAAAKRDIERQTALVVEANDNAAQLKRAADSGQADLRKSLQQERERAERLERDLAAAKREVETQTALATKANDDAAQLKQAADSGQADLRKSLQQERERAERLERDLAAAKRDVETQTALATKSNDAATQLKQAAESDTAELRNSLQQERERAEQFKQDLAVAKRDVETQTALATKANDDAAQLKQAAESDTAELRNSLQQERERAEQLKQDLAAAKRDVETQTALATKANDDAAQLKQAAESDTAELRNSLQQERERAERLKQDLAAAKRDVEMQTALVATESEEATRAKQAASDATALKKSLAQERERAAQLERDLAAAKRDAETQTALVAAESVEATRAKQAASDAAELKKSLAQERERAAQLEQDLAAAKRDVETQTALAAKAREEAGELKQTADNGAAELRKSLQEEQQNASALAQDLSTARAKIYAYEIQASKAGVETEDLKQTAESGAAELRKSLQEAQARGAQLEQDLAAARRDVEIQTALATKASPEPNQPKQVAENRSAELQNSLQQERERAAQLELDLAAAKRDAETQTALVATESEEATRARQAASDATALKKSLDQERERAAQLEQDLATAKRDAETQTALAAKAREEAGELKQTAENGAVELRKSLQEERQNASALAQDLSTARAKIYAYEIQASVASVETENLKQMAESGAAELRKSLQEAQARGAQLEQDLAAARRDVEIQTALATKASPEPNQLKQVAENSSMELQRSLQREPDRAEALAQDLSMVHTAIYAYEAQMRKTGDRAGFGQAESDTAEPQQTLVQEWERAARLQQALAAARREVETQMALAAKASAEATRLKQVAEDSSAGFLRSLQQERDKTARLARELASERKTNDAHSACGVVTAGQAVPDKQVEPRATKPVAPDEVTVGEVRIHSLLNREDAADVVKLVARANTLLGQGDVGSARIVLERAAETGSAQASFSLAETYDPLVLAKWQTYGTRGDAVKARDLYAKAQAGGIDEATERLDALNNYAPDRTATARDRQRNAPKRSR